MSESMSIYWLLVRIKVLFSRASSALFDGLAALCGL